MQLYQFEKIYSQMEKEFGKIKKGDEESYAMLLLPMEGNALKIHREFPSSNSRRLREAIALALFEIKDKYTGEISDTDKFRNADNERLEKALLMAFDPYNNDEVRGVLEEAFHTKEFTKEILRAYYKVPCMCMLRIKESIDTWEKQAGANGYFEFIENYMGNQLNGNKMEFSVMIGNELL